MEQNTLGVALRYYRKKYKFSMAEICEGICDEVSLSRLERGYREQDSLTAGAMLGRVGIEITQFELILNDEDFELYTLRNNIAFSFKKEMYDEAVRLLDKYEKLMPNDLEIHMQFVLYYRAMLVLSEAGLLKEQSYGKDLSENKTVQKACKMFYKALTITKPRLKEYLNGMVNSVFSKHTSKIKMLYNPFEIELILKLIDYGYSEYRQIGENELKAIIAYIQSYYPKKMYEETGIRIYTELINHSVAEQNYLKVIEYADKALKLISQGRNMNGMHRIYFIKAQALKKYYGNTSEWDKKEKDCKNACLIAYCLADVADDLQLIDNIVSFCKEELEWQITALEI